MKFKFIKAAVTGIILSVSSLANAGLIDSSSVLLDDSGATKLETWLGQGDLDWDSIWYGASGATSASWHTTVDNVNNTVSIYKAINNLGQEVLIGGYTTQDWSGISTYKVDGSAFIFNLTQDEVQFQQHHPQYAIRAQTNYFATFGGGHDIFGGAVRIGDNANWWTNGYTSNHTYDQTKGSIDVGTDNLSYAYTDQFRIISLETFTFSQAQDVPEPSTLAIFALGMIGLASRRFKKQS